MMKQHKYKTIITTLITLVPTLIGCILWTELPNKIATHFGADNAANGWSSKGFTVFGIPPLLAVIHLICLFASSADPKFKDMGKKASGIIFWIIPSISLFTGTLIYATALGIDTDIGLFVRLFFGILFVVLGNLLPKARQNHFLGIKVPWTLCDEENWNRTHRLAGWLMVLAGMAMIATAFLQTAWIVLAALATSTFIPIIYSYVHYKRHHSDT